MKILNLKIEGFRSLKAIDWSPGDLNVVIGPNNGGKSNLLNALEMIAASARGQLAKFVKSQGGMQSIVWDGQAESIVFNLETSDTKNVKTEPNIKFNYELELERIGSTSNYKIEKEILRSTNEGVIIENTPSFREVSKDTDIAKILNSDKETINSIGMIRSTKYQFHRIPSSWSIFQNLDTSKNSTLRQAFVTSHEKQIEPDGNNFIAVLHTLYEEDRDFKQEINQAMKAAFGGDFEELSLAPAADTRSQLRIFWKSLQRPRSAADISDGTLRFLYLLTILAHPEPPVLIAIDEPETGLHPSMLPIIAEYAVEASRKTQVILTTHSPEFLSAFGKEIRPTTTVVEWEDGQTKLRVLEGETFDYWLDKYSLGELYRSGQLEDME